MDLVSLIFKANTADLDRAEKKLDDVQKSAEGAGKSAKAMTSAFEGAKSIGGPIGDVADRLEDMKSRADGAMNAVRGLGASAGLAAASIVALVGAAGVLAALRFAGVLDDIGDMAEKLGLSATQAAILDQQMKAAGTSIDTYYGGIQRVANALTKADEEGQKAAEALKTLGTNVKDNATPQETMNALAEKYGEKLREGSVSVDEMAALQVVLGKNYRETIVATEQAAVAQERLNEFQRAGIGISSEGAKAAGAFEAANNDLQFVLQAVGSKLVGEVLPAFTGLINALVDSYKNGGLVKIALDGVRVAAQLVMVPIRALFNIFIQLDAAVQSVGKSLGAVFAAITSQSTAPLDALKQDLADIWNTANSRTTSIWSSDSGAVDAPKTTSITPSTGGGGKTKGGKADKPSFAGDADGPFKEWLKMKDEESKRHLADMKRYDEAEAAAEREYHSLMKRVQGYKDLADPAATYRREFEQLTADYEAGVVPLDAYIAKSKELGDQIRKVNETTTKGADDFDIMQRVGMTAFQGLENALVGLATTGKLSFKSFAQAILADIARMIIQLMIIKPLMASLGFGGVTKSANGNIFDGGLKKSANGNVFDSATLHGYRGGIGVLGEAGPEAVMPLKRGSDGKLGVMAGGGTGGTSQHITIQVTVEGGKDGDETGNAVAMKVQELFVRGVVRQELKTAARQKAYTV